MFFEIGFPCCFGFLFLLGGTGHLYSAHMASGTSGIVSYQLISGFTCGMVKPLTDCYLRDILGAYTHSLHTPS